MLNFKGLLKSPSSSETSANMINGHGVMSYVYVFGKGIYNYKQVTPPACSLFLFCSCPQTPKR